MADQSATPPLVTEVLLDLAAILTVDQEDAPAGPAAVDRPHIRIRYATLGAHTHCSVWSTERGGPDVTHGHNGALTFRNAEFEGFRAMIESGLSEKADVEFVQDPAQIGLARRDGIVNLNLPGDTPAEDTDA
jgi:hypothetical protein